MWTRVERLAQLHEPQQMERAVERAGFAVDAITTTRRRQQSRGE